MMQVIESDGNTIPSKMLEKHMGFEHVDTQIRWIEADVPVYHEPTVQGTVASE